MIRNWQWTGAGAMMSLVCLFWFSWSTQGQAQPAPGAPGSAARPAAQQATPATTDAPQTAEKPAAEKPAPGPAPPGPAAPGAAPTQAQLDERFVKMMENVALVGFFTFADRPVDKNGLKEERYTITSVKKINGDLWLFNARIQYGGKDVSLPLALPVKWAGDTPVISLSEMTIPGMGTFSTRLVLYKDQYAGIWTHGKAGGQMFGRIEKLPAPQAPAPPARAPPPPDHRSHRARPRPEESLIRRRAILRSPSPRRAASGSSFALQHPRVSRGKIPPKSPNGAYGVR